MYPYYAHPPLPIQTLHGGLVNLLYDDGERETRVPLSRVRHRGAPAPRCSDDSDASSGSDRSEQGMKVHGGRSAVDGECEMPPETVYVLTVIETTCNEKIWS